METKKSKNTNKSPKREKAGKCVDNLKTKFGGKKCDTQFSSTGQKKNNVCMTYKN